MQRGEEAGLKPELAWARDLDWGRSNTSMACLAASEMPSKPYVRLQKGAQLCLATLGLDKVPAGRPCFGYQLHTCSGVCVGQESLAAHSARLQNVLTNWPVRVWPFDGPVMAREGQAWHVLDAWCYLVRPARRLKYRPC